MVAAARPRIERIRKTVIIVFLLNGPDAVHAGGYQSNPETWPSDPYGTVTGPRAVGSGPAAPTCFVLSGLVVDALGSVDALLLGGRWCRRSPSRRNTPAHSVRSSGSTRGRAPPWVFGSV